MLLVDVTPDVGVFGVPGLEFLCCVTLEPVIPVGKRPTGDNNPTEVGVVSVVPFGVVGTPVF